VEAVQILEVQPRGTVRRTEPGTFRGSWLPLPARKVLIPKPGSSERRPLAIAAVRGRIVQAAMKIMLEPVFEADFLPAVSGSLVPGLDAELVRPDYKDSTMVWYRGCWRRLQKYFAGRVGRILSQCWRAWGWWFVWRGGRWARARGPNYGENFYDQA
jgi:hypothetical protein